MRAEDYLAQLNKLDRLIFNTMAEIDRWKDIATGCTVQMDGERVQSSGAKSKIENAVVSYADLQKKLEIQVKRAEEKRVEILKTIYEALSADQYDVIYRIYARGMLLKEVESDLKRSKSWVSKNHRSGIVALQKYLDAKERK